MKILKEFEVYLDKNFSGDDWADWADEDAIRLLKKFTDEEWEALKTLWRRKSAAWQERLASIIGEENPEVCLQILEDMVFGQNIKVSDRALDTLEVSDNIYRPSPKMTDWLKDKLEKNDEKYWKDTLKTILSFNDLPPLRGVRSRA